MTNKEAIRMEATSTDRNVRFAINYARHQYGMRTARAVAHLISEGVSVQPHGDGFLVGGSYYPWETVARQFAAGR